MASSPGEFPQPQYCPTLVKLYEGAAAPSVAASDPLRTMQGCAVVLLGDAAHAFPPDLGQGVNSALQDVHVLSECVAESNALGASFADALQRYQEQRLPDVKALIRLMQVRRGGCLLH